MKNKNSAATLAFFLGGVGVHRFYLGETGWGVLYAIFFWTYIPTIAGIIESIMLLGMTEQDFDQKYNHKTLLSYESRQLTNYDFPAQVVVNIGDRSVSASYKTAPDAFASNRNTEYTIVPNDEIIDRRILKLCQLKGEITLLDCFLEIEDIPKNTLQTRIDSLVREEFLQIGNRVSDGKVVYRLDN